MEMNKCRHGDDWDVCHMCELEEIRKEDERFSSLEYMCEECSRMIYTGTLCDGCKDHESDK